MTKVVLQDCHEYEIDLLIDKINAGVADYLKLNNLRGISELVGSLRTD